MLATLLFLPILTAFFIMAIPKENEKLIKIVSFSITLFLFYYTLSFWLFFDIPTTGWQFTWAFSYSNYLGSHFLFAIDSLSLFFVNLTTFIIPVCLLASWKNRVHVRAFCILFLFIEAILLILFTTLDLLVFFIFFEALIIPMFFLIGQWGTGTRKVRANYYFVLYTLFGSLFFLYVLLMVMREANSTSLLVLANHPFSPELQKTLWLAFFLSFAIKIPIFPFHLWLIWVHVEAPTSGSVLLAGVLLKLGFYGLIRFAFTLFPIGTEYFSPLAFTLALLSIFYGGLTTLRQVDIKRIIAYSSIVHMNYGLLGLFSNTIEGITGSIFVMLSHGLVASALFLAVGFLYDRYHSRLIRYYSGLSQILPLYCTVLFLLTIANFGFPGTSSFIGEFLILVGIFQHNAMLGILAGVSLFLGTVFSLWLFNRISFGNVNTPLKQQVAKADLSVREASLSFILLFLIIWFGLFPNSCLQIVTTAAITMMTL